jgi:hypothetical protein
MTYRCPACLSVQAATFPCPCEPTPTETPEEAL